MSKLVLLREKLQKKLEQSKQSVSMLDEYDRGCFAGFEQALEYCLELIEELKDE